MVTQNDVKETLKKLGVKNGDILLFHSSLKSFGLTENGADTIINGALNAVGKLGTLVAPTLVQRNFSNAYKTWDKYKSPSDVGFITETLRKRNNAYRSDQATHSVAAIGKLAEFITNSHSTSKPRKHPYGDYAFSHGSPWQKMYDLGGKVVFMGCGLEANTYHHFIEAIFTEEILSMVKDENKQILDNLVTFDTREEHERQLKEESCGGKTHTLIRFQFGKRHQRNRTLESGICKEAFCGSSKFLLFNIKEYVDGVLDEVRTYTDEFYTDDVLNLIDIIKKQK